MKKPYIHSKAFLVDERWLLIGSMNMSTNSLDKNREVGIILIDQSQISSFLQQFNTDW
jgi:phosphatidylserine/phosphatidylglycerophosphate/cardiolipin synthase-like enzyme